MSRALRALQRLRRHREDQASTRLGLAERAVRDAVAAREAAEPAANAFTEPVSPETLRALRATDLGAYERLRALHQEAELAEIVRQRAYLEWSAAATSRRQIERLDERQRRQRVAAANAARHKALDAAATMRWRRSR